MSAASYADTSSVADARDQYFAANGFSLASYSDRWVKLKLGPIPSWRIDSLLLSPRLASWTGSPGRPSLLTDAAYFGLAFGAMGWWKLTARDRPAR